MLHLFLIWRGENQQPARSTDSSVLSMWPHPINLGRSVDVYNESHAETEGPGSKSFRGSGLLPSVPAPPGAQSVQAKLKNAWKRKHL